LGQNSPVSSGFIVIVSIQLINSVNASGEGSTQLF